MTETKQYTIIGDEDGQGAEGDWTPSWASEPATWFFGDFSVGRGYQFVGVIQRTRLLHNGEYAQEWLELDSHGGTMSAKNGETCAEAVVRWMKEKGIDAKVSSEFSGFSGV